VLPNVTFFDLEASILEIAIVTLAKFSERKILAHTRSCLRNFFNTGFTFFSFSAFADPAQPSAPVFERVLQRPWCGEPQLLFFHKMRIFFASAPWANE
jgi:hypothetical protein